MALTIDNPRFPVRSPRVLAGAQGGLDLSGFGRPVLGTAGGGVNAPKPRLKTGYTEFGAPVDVSEGTELSRWQPNTGYTGGVTFDAPPPNPLQVAQTEQMREATAGARQGREQVAQDRSMFGAGGAAMAGLQASVPTSRLRQAEAGIAEDPNAAFERQKELLRVQGAQSEAAARLQAQLARESEDRRFARVPEFMKMLPPLEDGGAGQGVDPELEKRARDAAFSRAKERAGSTALSAVRGLREVMAGQGLAGSTVEAAGLGNVIGEAGGGVQDVAREQAVQEAARAGQISDRDVQAKLTRRGQDIARQQALLSLFGGLY